MKLNVKAFALAGGILWGASMFIITWWVMQFPATVGISENVAQYIGKTYYIGYELTPKGSVIGAGYGFFDAGIGCAIFALLYNKLSRSGTKE